MTGDNAPPPDGWVCYPRPCVFDAVVSETTAPDEPHLIRGEWVKARSRTFIPAKLEDNPDLANTDYAATLAALPEELRAAYRDGRFDLGLKDAAYQVLADINGLLARQDQILAEIQRVVAGMPEDETLRLFNEGAQQLADAAQAVQARRAASSEGQAGTRRRRRDDHARSDTAGAV